MFIPSFLLQGQFQFWTCHFLCFLVGGSCLNDGGQLALAVLQKISTSLEGNGTSEKLVNDKDVIYTTFQVKSLLA